MAKAAKQPNSSSSYAPYQNEVINDFSAGLNTLYNPRALAPNPQIPYPQPAESPFMQNIDIVSKGALQTSLGYTLVASLPNQGNNATATAISNGNTITAINVTNGGNNYSESPIVSITYPANQVGALQAVLSGSTVGSINIINGGNGYISAPNLTITGGGGTGATANCTISGGIINSVTITAPGTGYTSSPQVIIETGSGATATATVVAGIVTAINITNAGSDYFIAPLVTIQSQSGVNSLIDYEFDNPIQGSVTVTLTAGAITGVNITNPGYGYNFPPIVTVTPTNGMGSGALIELEVNNGQLVSFIILNGGSGYTAPPTITLFSYCQVAIIDNLAYYLLPGDSVLHLIGTIGARAQNYNMQVFQGHSGQQIVIFGSDNMQNTMMSWDGTHFNFLPQTAPLGGYIMEVYTGQLAVAVGNTLYLSDTYDETNWTSGGTSNAQTKPFNEDITAIHVLDQLCVIYTKRNGYQLQANFNSTSAGGQVLVFAATPFRNSSGSLASKSASSIYNDIYALSTDGVQRFGADPQFISSNQRINSLSWKIDLSLLPQNLNTQFVNKSASIYFQKKFYVSLPYGNQQFNSQTFIYNYNYDAWSSRSGIFASQFSIAPDQNNLDGLYFGNPVAPEIYKFYTNYDYNGNPYPVMYQTKIFNMGDGMRSKMWQWIDIKGAMYINTIYYVDLTVDGMTKTYQINQANLDPAGGGGGYYGDEYYGDDTYGGTINPTFFRYGARLPFPIDIRTGRELQLTFRNNAAGQPFAIDYLNIVWQWEDLIKLPYNYQNAQLTN